MKPSKLYEVIRERMKLVRPSDLSRASGVQLRQLRRVQDGDNSPTIATLERVYEGLKICKKRPPK